MREILFRGKRKGNGKWVEGGYFSIQPIENEEPLNIIVDGSVSYHIVDPDTVGQFTGLTDKNGKRIFEGDIVAQSWYDFDEPADDCFGEVIFSVADCSFSVLCFDKSAIMSMGQGCAYHWEVEVIGNIHDNPDLLNTEATV